MLSFYGYMGMQSEQFEESYTGFMERYEARTESAQELLKQGKELAESFGGKLVYERKEDDYSALYVAVAVLDSETSGDTKLEQTYLDKALEYGNLDAYEQYVLFDLRNDNISDARQKLSEAIKVGLDSYRRYYLTGRVYEANGEAKKAWMEYKKALLLAPDEDKEDISERIAQMEE